MRWSRALEELSAHNGLALLLDLLGLAHFTGPLRIPEIQARPNAHPARAHLRARAGDGPPIRPGSATAAAAAAAPGEWTTARGGPPALKGWGCPSG